MSLSTLILLDLQHWFYTLILAIFIVGAYLTQNPYLLTFITPTKGE